MPYYLSITCSWLVVLMIPLWCLTESEVCARRLTSFPPTRAQGTRFVCLDTSDTKSQINAEDIISKQSFTPVSLCCICGLSGSNRRLYLAAIEMIRLELSSLSCSRRMSIVKGCVFTAFQYMHC